jgi:hypothetical protein
MNVRTGGGREGEMDTAVVHSTRVNWRAGCRCKGRKMGAVNLHGELRGGENKSELKARSEIIHMGARNAS